MNGDLEKKLNKTLSDPKQLDSEQFYRKIRPQIELLREHELQTPFRSKFRVEIAAVVSIASCMIFIFIYSLRVVLERKKENSKAIVQ